MSTVLLAVNGPIPDANTLQYALDLCRRIQADLKVLQIIQSKEVGAFFRKFKEVADKARYFFEGSMAATAFAEMGEFESARQLMEEAEHNMQNMLPQNGETGIQSELVMIAGKSEEVIVNYVQENKDIVLAVYDCVEDKNAKKKSKRQISREVQALTKKMAIPVVIVPVPDEK